MACRICFGSIGEIHIAKESLLGLDETFRYFECAGCGCLQLDQGVDDLGRFYGGAYGTAASSALKQQLRTAMYRASYSPSELIAKAMCAFSAGCNYGLMRTLRTMRQDVAILDIGCGKGRLLHSLRKLGFTGRLVGVDPFLSADELCDDGVELRKSTLTEFEGEGAFNVISMMHSLEHIANQEDTLESLRRMLSSSGVCVISIPIANSRQWRMHATQWVQMDPPRHLFLHTAKSLAILAGRHQLSLERTINESSAFQFWGTALVKKGVPLLPMSKAYVRSLWRIPTDMIRATFANSKGTGDTATFILRPQ